MNKKQFMALKRPLIAVDIVIKHYDKNGRFDGIVLIERNFRPKGISIPGGFVNYNETLEKAAKRESFEETGLKVTELKQFKAYSDPRRDKRFHTITVALVGKARGTPKGASDAKKAFVIKTKDALRKRLCFDHNKILRDAKKAGLI